MRLLALLSFFALLSIAVQLDAGASGLEQNLTSGKKTPQMSGRETAGELRLRRGRGEAILGIIIGSRIVLHSCKDGSCTSQGHTLNFSRNDSILGKDCWKNQYRTANCYGVYKSPTFGSIGVFAPPRGAETHVFRPHDLDEWMKKDETILNLFNLKTVKFVPREIEFPKVKSPSSTPDAWSISTTLTTRFIQRYKGSDFYKGEIDWDSILISPQKGFRNNRSTLYTSERLECQLFPGREKCRSNGAGDATDEDARRKAKAKTNFCREFPEEDTCIDFLRKAKAKADFCREFPGEDVCDDL